MNADVIWIVGTCIAILSLTGGVIARDRYVMARINDGDAKNEESTKAVDDKCQERLNYIKDNFVRRDDMNTFRGEIRDTIKEGFATLREEQRVANSEMREEQRATNARIDLVLNKIK